MKFFLALYQFLILKLILPVLTCCVHSVLIIILLVFKQYKAVGYVLQNWGWMCFFLLGKKYTIKGLENLNSNKRYLILSNHGSMLDIPLVALLIPIPISWVLKAELLKIPVVNWMFQLGIGIPISRNNAKESQQTILNRVQKLRDTLNPNIFIYPEGTRTKTGDINTFKRGFVQVMRNYELDILPITVSGVVNFYSGKQKFPNPDSEIQITIHPEESYNKLKELPDKEIAQYLQGIIADAYYQ